MVSSISSCIGKTSEARSRGWWTFVGSDHRRSSEHPLPRPEAQRSNVVTMPQLRHRLFGLCLLPTLLACLDFGLTLGGQPAEYWVGNYSRVNELSPTFHQLLAWHPLALVAGTVLWILIFVSLILLLPQTLALTLSIAVVLGHTLGATSWLIYRIHYGYQAVCGLFLLAAIGLAVGILWGWQAEPRSDARLGASLPVGLRWLVIALLLGVAVYLFLWPRNP